jgi:hypothetical protein
MLKHPFPGSPFQFTTTGEGRDPNRARECWDEMRR